MIRLVPRSSRRVGLLVVLLLLLVVVGSVSYVGWRQSVAGVSVTATPPRLLGGKTPVKIALEATRGNVARAEVRLVQAGKTIVLAKHEGGGSRRVELTATLEAAGGGAREGGAGIEARARDDIWRPNRLDDRVLATNPLTVDLTPPRIEVVAATPYLHPGGAGLVVFKPGDAVRMDAHVGALAFPAFPVGPPEAGLRIVLFALPYDYAAGTPITLAATDEAGNAASRGVPGELLPRKFKHDTIDLKDPFLQAKVPELLPQHPQSAPLLDGFLIINREQRKQAEEEKRKFAAKTADKFLWEGPFVQPRNTKVSANFAETRTYTYNGREVDTQVHYGYDLASTKQAAAPAANKGVVVFAGPLTIYGNTVVLDHGLGLMTLYAHLSSIGVKVGDPIEKEQELGRTGTTGLAIGDHLHYEVLVHGVSVTPVEWWDAKWIRDRLNTPLRAAGLAEIAGVEGGGGDAAVKPRPAAKSRAKR
jgi:murein DD-endopeptidase MepM/ murein hydrolase activator NlpD